MNPWETMRREILDAWRSIRSDRGHRTGVGNHNGVGNRTGGATGPDHAAGAARFDAVIRAGDGASVGCPNGGPGGRLGTDGARFGADASGRLDAAAAADADAWRRTSLPARESIWAPLRDPRRMLAAGTVASVIAASAIGTFFAVTGSLGVLVADASADTPASQTVSATSTPAPGSSGVPGHRRSAPTRHPSAPASAPGSAGPAASGLPSGTPASDTPATATATATPVPTTTPVPDASSTSTPAEAPVKPSAVQSPVPEDAPLTTPGKKPSLTVTPPAEAAP
ncbi:hypothetical protein ACNTMW_12180 [Planosporangium sp. 12N6]|uniref:hypothetical protein n=1 Tax=Planosporangium spinosum TaxID=3402278 RepID=UPI003CF2B2D1